MNFKTINNITLPSRSEIIMPIEIDIQEDSLVCGKEIQKGVFVANSIIPSEGNKHIKILNTRDTPVTIKKSSR